MSKKYDLPDWVLVHKIKGRSVKVKGNNYYLYEQKCIYDKKRKHKNYTTETYLGRITKENGFIPAKSNSVLYPERITSKVFGPFSLINNLCEDILGRLANSFGEKNGEKIFTIAALRTIENNPYYNLEDAYEESYASVLYKNLSMSKSSLCDFLHDLSRHKESFKIFMREDFEKDETLIFDGTNILCGSQNISYSASGYKHGHNYSSQVTPLYAYSATKKKMVYYKLNEGSVSDAKSLTDIINEMSLKSAVAILDNGFSSTDNIQGLLENKTNYLIALRRDSAFVTDEILNDATHLLAKEKFTNNKEAIFAYEVKAPDNTRICIYFNQTIKGVETTEYLDKMSKGWKGYTQDGFIKAQQRFGIFIIKTNTDFNLQKIYELYKSRFEIEYVFDSIKNTLNFDKSWMHSDKSLESWMFINHISIMMMQRVYDSVKEKKLNLSLNSLFKKLRRIVKQRYINTVDDSYVLEVVPKKVREIAEKLGVIS